MSELEKLKKKNKELEDKVLTLEFASEISKELLMQKDMTIKQILEQHAEFKKKSAVFDDKSVVKKILNRIEIDNIKYIELQSYLLKEFPGVLKPDNRNNKIDSNEKKPEEQIDENLSQSYINENGKLYETRHIIDVAIILIAQLKMKLDSMLGDDDKIDF